VLCDFGRNGVAYVKTDPAAADELTITCAIVTGEYERPLRVISCNPAEGWCRDVSAQITKSLADVEELPAGARAFVEMHAGRGRDTPREETPIERAMEAIKVVKALGDRQPGPSIPEAIYK
jgi:hypothetical protein